MSQREQPEKKNNKLRAQFDFEPEFIEYIDEMSDAGGFSSRADYVRNASMLLGSLIEKATNGPIVVRIIDVAGNVENLMLPNINYAVAKRKIKNLKSTDNKSS